jgi:hypothetical protein
MLKSLNSVVVLLTAILGLSFTGAAQTPSYVTLYSGTNGINYPVQTNQLVSLVGYDWTDQPYVYGILANGKGISLLAPSATQAATNYANIPQIVTGLTNIGVNAGDFKGVNEPGWATFQITTPGWTTVVSNYVPADAIVIPSSVTGNVQIILESSSDLVNWTAASPGTYGASSGTNRFFRVRAAMQ